MEDKPHMSMLVDVGGTASHRVRRAQLLRVTEMKLEYLREVSRKHSSSRPTNMVLFVATQPLMKGSIGFRSTYDVCYVEEATSCPDATPAVADGYNVSPALSQPAPDSICFTFMTSCRVRLFNFLFYVSQW
jgi:hypothetical protein